MKKIIHMLILSVLLPVLILSALPIDSEASSKDANIHKFHIYIRGNQREIEGTAKKYADAEALGSLFGVNIKSQDKGRAVMIEHLYYNDGIRPYKDKAYIDVQRFFNFFDISFKKTQDNILQTEMTRIPLFDKSIQKKDGEGEVKVGGNSSKAPTILIKKDKYVELEALSGLLNLSAGKDANNRPTLNGKPVERWLPVGGKTYVNVKDASKASGKPIS